MAYSELIKKFDHIRAYMRDFYVYGFKTRTEYDQKSPRSYDDMRRRIESWLGDHMRFTQTAEGKRVFLSVDSRQAFRNPLFKAWKSMTFTDGDITLHFFLFDILHAPEVALPLAALVDEVDRRLRDAGSEQTFDDSTIRKKLKEYVALGLLRTVRQGRQVLYSRMPDTPWEPLADAVDFFSEAAPLGVVGSFLQDRLPEHARIFSFKHHYIAQTMDSGILEQLFLAMREKRCVTIESLNRHQTEPYVVRLVPLRIYVSAQHGRQYLIALQEQSHQITTCRIDFILRVRAEAVCEAYDRHLAAFRAIEPHAWGVNFRSSVQPMEHVSFDVRVAEDEGFLRQRLEREKRCGTVTQVDAHTWRYTADVFDTFEMLPWIRTFIGRITQLSFSNVAAESRFRADLARMYQLYGAEGGDNA